MLTRLPPLTAPEADAEIQNAPSLAPPGSQAKNFTVTVKGPGGLHYDPSNAKRRDV